MLRSGRRILSSVKFLGDPYLVFGDIVVPVPSRRDNQIKSVIGTYVAMRLEGRPSSTIEPSEIANSKKIRDACRLITDALPEPHEAYKPADLLQDLPQAQVDVLMLADALQRRDEDGIAELMSGVNDLFVAVTDQIPDRLRPQVVGTFKRLASPFLMREDEAYDARSSVWLDVVRLSYRRVSGTDEAASTEGRTTSILESVGVERIDALRDLWSELYDKGQLHELDRSLKLSRAAFGGTFPWSVAMANCRLAQGVVDAATEHLREAKSLYPAAASDRDEIALAHLSARLEVRKHETSERVRVQEKHLERAIAICEGVGALSPHIDLLLANTLVRRAFHCGSPDSETWISADQSHTQSWCEQADDLFAKLDETHQKTKALVGRCYLHHLGKALRFGRGTDLREELRGRLRSHIDQPAGKADFAAIAGLAYGCVLVGETSGADAALQATDLSRLGDRRDQQAMWCSLLGYLYCSDPAFKEAYRRSLLRFVREGEFRVVYNYHPLVHRNLLPFPSRFHEVLFWTCRWGKGTSPLRHYHHDLMRFLEPAA